jgi:hypothetical protein
LPTARMPRCRAWADVCASAACARRCTPRANPPIVGG